MRLVSFVKRSQVSLPSNAPNPHTWLHTEEVVRRAVGVATSRPREKASVGNYVAVISVVDFSLQNSGKKVYHLSCQSAVFSDGSLSWLSWAPLQQKFPASGKHI